MYVYGELLRGFRQREGLTQRALAEHLGVHRNTISDWERSIYLPDTPEIIQDLADALTLSSAETDQLLVAAHYPIASHPIPALPAHHRLSQPTSFVGREDELAEIRRLLCWEPACRLLTLVGPGGIGKTRLALAVVHMMPQSTTPSPSFPISNHASPSVPTPFTDGIFFVPLDAVNHPEFLASAIAEAIHFAFDGTAAPKTQLLSYLYQKKMLLVLDNFEQIIEGAALLATIASTAAGVKILVTSRERLHVQEEWNYDVAGLPFPPADDNLLEKKLDVLMSYSAVQLFVQRAQQAQARFTLTHEKGLHIVRICQLLAGMPLGLELAAAWVRMMTCQEIATEIAQSFDFLTTTMRNVPARHRSLRGVFHQVWQRLTHEEQRLFCQLSVFRNGFGLRAARQVTGASLPLLSALVDKSLLRRRRETSALGRYEIHALSCQYGAEKLAQDAALQRDAQDRHSSYYCHWLQTQAALPTAAAIEQNLTAIEDEIDNINAAWQWSVQERCFDRLAAVMEGFFGYYLRGGREHTGRALCERSIEQLTQTVNLTAAATPATPINTAPINTAPINTRRQRVIVQLMVWRARFNLRLGSTLEAITQIEAALAILESEQFVGQDARQERADTLLLLGHALYLRNLPRAYLLYQDAHLLYQQLRDDSNRASTLAALGSAAQDLGELTQAIAYHEASVTLRQQLGGPSDLGESLYALAESLQERLNLVRAKELLEQAIDIFARNNDVRRTAHGISRLGLLAIYRCDYRAAIVYFEQAIAKLTQIDRRHEAINSCYYAATAYLCLNNDAHSARYLTECRALAQHFDEPFWLARCTFLTGCRLISTQQPAQALECLHIAERQLATLGNPVELHPIWAMASYGHLQQGEYVTALQKLHDALDCAITYSSAPILGLSLPAVALLLQQQPEKLVHAVEVYALAQRLPYAGNSAFFEQIAGKQIIANANLSPSVLAAALACGRTLDLWATARRLRAELAEQKTEANLPYHI